MARLSYLELPVRDLAAGKEFYEHIFDWTLTDFGPTYAATITGDTDVGLQADTTETTAALLPVIAVDDLTQTLARVTAAGGIVTRPVFDFPGGQRFHFRDPAGHELAVMTTTTAA